MPQRRCVFVCLCSIYTTPHVGQTFSRLVNQPDDKNTHRKTNTFIHNIPMAFVYGSAGMYICLFYVFTHISIVELARGWKHMQHARRSESTRSTGKRRLFFSKLASENIHMYLRCLCVFCCCSLVAWDGWILYVQHVMYGNIQSNPTWTPTWMTRCEWAADARLDKRWHFLWESLMRSNDSCRMCVLCAHV